MIRLMTPVLTAAAIVLVTPDLAEACQVCFKDPNSPMTRGAQAGVWFLLAVVVAVEAAFGVFFFIYLRKRFRFYADGNLKPSLHLTKH